MKASTRKLLRKALASRGVACDSHPDENAVATLRWVRDGVMEKRKVCVACGDYWHAKYGNTSVGKTLVILPIDQKDWD